MFIFKSVPRSAVVIAFVLLGSPAWAQFRDGWYFYVTGENMFAPMYSIHVVGGLILQDTSDRDDYDFCVENPYFLCRRGGGSFGVNRNSYMHINRNQILRITPDGKKVVLTWYKNALE